MSTVIIGIHGLGNKPPVHILKKWWLRSIREGFLAFHCPLVFFKFELCYWADIVHPVPLNPKSDDKNDSLSDQEPYVRASKYEVREPNAVKRKMLDLLEKRMDKAFAASKLSKKLNVLSDALIQNFFKDLDIYFSKKKKKENPVNTLIKNRLVEMLRRHKNDRILIIAHSMGSIITYDVLSHLPEVSIDTLVTIGSPLGLPFIKSKFAGNLQSAGKLKSLKTPDSVHSGWYNLSDLDDKVTVNYNLADDYSKNSKGVGATDLIVGNNYEYHGQKNHHKAYGYLRTPEMASILYEFIKQDRNGLHRAFDRAVYHIVRTVSGVHA